MIQHNKLIKIQRDMESYTDPLRMKIMEDENMFPFNAKIGMVFTTYVDHMPYIKYALSQYRKIEDMFIIGAYDSRTITPEAHERNIPYGDIWSLAHMWISKHKTWGGHAKRHGWIWSHIYAYSILKTFPNMEYIFSVNGDCIWEKPEGVYEIIDLLGDNEFMAGQSETRETDGFNFIHTLSMIFKRKSYFSFIDFIINKMPESNTVSFSPEGLIQQWVREYNVKWKHAPIQPIYKEGQYKGRHDTYCEENNSSTWKNVLGFRNLEAEKNYRCTNKINPLPKKYLDLRDESYYKDHDRNTILKYYKTGDEKYLKLWWYLDGNLPTEERLKRMKMVKRTDIDKLIAG
jgi:hypothetical protein